MTETLKSAEILDEVRKSLGRLSQQLEADGIDCQDAKKAIAAARNELYHVAIDIEERVYGLQYSDPREEKKNP